MKYRRIVHYSKHKRDDGHPGGVEKFAWYLRQAVGCDILTPSDHPDLADPLTLYVVDNHFGLDVAPDCRVVCMVHGCAEHEGHNRRVGKLQRKMSARPNTRYVANSSQTQQLYQQLYGVTCEVIHLAVDESLYFPRLAHQGRRVLTTTAGKHHKGAHVVPKIQKLLRDQIDIAEMACALNEEANAFKQADAFMLLSKHEGFAYSVLEAMCANLPVVTGPHGIAFELAGHGVIRILDEENLWKPTVVAQAIEEALSQPASTRQWVLDNCSLERFKTRWQAVVEQEHARG